MVTFRERIIAGDLFLDFLDWVVTQACKAFQLELDVQGRITVIGRGGFMLCDKPQYPAVGVVFQASDTLDNTVVRIGIVMLADDIPSVGEWPLT